MWENRSKVKLEQESKKYLEENKKPTSMLDLKKVVNKNEEDNDVLPEIRSPIKR